MRGNFTYHYVQSHLSALWFAGVSRLPALIAWCSRYWQPITVVCGALLAAAGITVTVARLTVWLVPALGWAPAATLAGVLTTALALRWARLTIEEKK